MKLVETLQLFNNNNFKQNGFKGEKTENSD